MRSYTLILSEEIDNRISQIAARNSITKAEAMRNAFALLAFADRIEQKGDGSCIGVVRLQGQKLEAVGKIVGLGKTNR